VAPERPTVTDRGAYCRLSEDRSPARNRGLLWKATRSGEELHRECARGGGKWPLPRWRSPKKKKRVKDATPYRIRSSQGRRVDDHRVKGLRAAGEFQDLRGKGWAIWEKRSCVGDQEVLSKRGTACGDKVDGAGPRERLNGGKGEDNRKPEPQGQWS